MPAIYQADLYCDECADAIRAELAKPNLDPWDSGEYPVDCTGTDEADSPQHCGECHKFLENDLTDDGRNYVAEMIAEWIATGRGSADVLLEWARFYESEVSDIAEGMLWAAALQRLEASVIHELELRNRDSADTRCHTCDTRLTGAACPSHSCPSHDGKYDSPSPTETR